MGTAVVELPPSLSHTPQLGQATGIGLGMQKTQTDMLELQAERRELGIEPAVILNFNPFALKVEAINIPYSVPRAEPNEEFTVMEIKTDRYYTRYNRTSEDDEGNRRREFTPEHLSPIHQAMEFYRVYGIDGEAGGDAPMGGVLVFRGGTELLNDRHAVVEVPYYKQIGRKKIVAYTKIKLAEKIKDILAGQRQQAMNFIQQGNDYDKQDDMRRNISVVHRTWAQYALDRGWIKAMPGWCNARPEDPVEIENCKACGNEYKSMVGVCGCGHVQYPLLAYESAKISLEHVAMDRLTPKEWAVANALSSMRQAAREGKDPTPAQKKALRAAKQALTAKAEPEGEE